MMIKETTKNTVANLKDIENTIEALETVDADENRPDDFMPMAEEFEKLQMSIPQKLIASDKESMPSMVWWPSSEDRENKKKMARTLVRSNELIENTDKLFKEEAVYILNQTANNFEVIWSRKGKCGIEDTKNRMPMIYAYTEAHNKFIRVQKIYNSSVEIPLGIEFRNKYVEVEESGKIIEKQEIDPTFPSIIEVAEYIVASNDTSNNILYHCMPPHEGDYTSRLAAVERQIGMLDDLFISELKRTFGSVDIEMITLTKNYNVDFDRRGRRFIQPSDEDIENIKSSIAELVTKFATDQKIAVTITLTGYSDSAGFDENTKIVKEIIKDIGDNLPKKQPDRRKMLNKELSRLRAFVTSQRIEKILKDILGNKHEIKSLIIIGKGEDIPEDMGSLQRTCDILLMLKGWPKTDNLEPEEEVITG
ncbi:MAG: hypothetical protein GY795_12890 [Desulfobacterales bacterium]|nr:hypothetical protein [Desulfobacterales bacterium]